MLALLLGCDRSGRAGSDASRTAPRPTEVDAHAGDDPYATYKLPVGDGTWSIADYVAVSDAVAEIAADDPKLLPTVGGPHEDLILRFTSLAAITGAFEARSDLDEGARLHDAAGRMFGVYIKQLKRDPEFDDEVVIVTAAFLRVATLLIPATATEIGLEELRTQPVRFDGLLQSRAALVRAYLLPLEIYAESPPLDAGFAAERLRPVTADVAPYMLSGEREQFDEIGEQLTRAGVDADVVRQMAKTIHEAPTSPLVTEFEAEHRAYAAE